MKNESKLTKEEWDELAPHLKRFFRCANCHEITHNTRSWHATEKHVCSICDDCHKKILAQNRENLKKYCENLFG